MCFPLLSQIFPISPKQHIFVLMQLSLVAARGREDSISSTYDSFVPNQVPGLPQRTKAGSLAVNGAPERVQKGADAVQQVGPSHAVTTYINLSPSVAHAMPTCKTELLRIKTEGTRKRVMKALKGPTHR